MAYDLATVTNSGNQLLASVVPDKSSLVIDKIEVSGTQLASSTDLKSMTSISNVVQTLSANGYQKKDNSFIISTVLDNSSVKVDYKAWVFGIWAHKSDGGSSILMSVITSTDSPDTISKGAGTPIDYNYKFVTTFSNTNSLKIKMSSDTYATNDTVLHNSGDETATGTKTFQEIKISNKKFPSLVQTDGQYVTLDGGNTEIVPADNSKVVHTTGDETIDGKKKFDTDPTDGSGNAYAKTVDVNQQLDKKVNIADMRKPASDVAGIEEVSALQTQVNNSVVGTNLLVGTSGQLKTGVIKKGTFHQDAIPFVPIIAGNYYTYRSFIANSQIDLEAGIDFFNSNHDWIGYVGGNIVKAGTSGYSTVKFMARDGAYFINPVYARVTQSPYGENKSISWSQEKLEKGSVATDWCPNPDDKVNVADMRKPASDVAGIEEVNTKQDKIGYTPADDSKVVHSTDTANWQKQAMFNPGNYNIDGTTKTTDFATLLRTKYNKAGVVYIRDNDLPSNSFPIDAVVICEGGSWWYAYGVTSIGNFVHRQIAPTYDTGWVLNADDFKVAHLSGANNFDTTPTVNNNPLLLASSLPSDLARTGQANTFNLTQTFSQGVKTLQTGSYDDANSLVNEGLYYNTNSSIKNGAGSLTTGYIQVMSGGGEIVRQIMYSDTNGGVMYDRTSQNGGSSWSDWVQIVTFDQIPGDTALLDQDANFTAKLQQNGQDVALANNTLARNPDTGKATEAIDFDPGKLTIGGNPALSIVMCTNEADAKAKSAVNPNPIYVYPKES